MAEIQPLPTPEQSIGKASAAGIVWTTGLSLASRLFNFMAQLILAKILLPEDFGAVGLAYTISGLFGVLTGFGIEQVFQQRRPRMAMWATQAFFLSLGLSITVAIAMAIYAPIGARVYHNKQVASLVWLIALALPFSALCTVPQAKLKSMLRFKFLAIYTSCELLGGQILIILLALSGCGALSFMIPVPIVAIVRALIFWRVAPMKLRPLRYAKGWTRMLSRGIAALGINIVTAVVGQGDYITLGLMAPAHVVGVYYFAFKIAAQPVIMLSNNFISILRPALVAMEGDIVRQRSAALKVARLLELLTLPVCYLQAAIAGPGLKLLFGDRWLESVPLIQILSLGLSFDAASWAAAAFLESRGNFAKSFKYQLITAHLFFILVGAGALFGSATGVAIGVSLYYVIHPVFLTTIVFRKHGGANFHQILSCFYTPCLIGLITIGSAYLISLLPIFAGSFVAQIAVILLGGPAYLLVVRIAEPEMFAEVRDKLFKKHKVR